ncbi:MAG: hypothetical protein JWL81_2246 [Verrucomicrobiales bacterium]|nr:hypothetical protein [Verrucomicrobiales bacterium]
MKTKPSLLLTSLSFFLCPLLPAGAQEQQPRFGYGALPRGAYVIPAPKSASSSTTKSSSPAKPKPKVAAATPKAAVKPAAKPTSKPTAPKTAVAKSSSAKTPAKELASSKSKAGNNPKPKAPSVGKSDSSANRSSRKTEIAKVSKKPQPAKSPAPSASRNRPEVAVVSPRDRTAAARPGANRTSKSSLTAKTGTTPGPDKNQVRILPAAPSLTASTNTASNNSLADLAGPASRDSATLHFLGLPIHVPALAALPTTASTGAGASNAQPAKPRTTVDLIAARHSLDNSSLTKSPDSGGSKSSSKIAAAERATVAAAQSPNLDSGPAGINASAPSATAPSTETAAPPAPQKSPALTSNSTPEPAPVIAPEPLQMESLVSENNALAYPPAASASAIAPASMDSNPIPMDESAETRSVPASFKLASIPNVREPALENTDISEPAPPALKEVSQPITLEPESISSSTDSDAPDSKTASILTENAPALTLQPDADSAPALPARSKTPAKPAKAMSPHEVTETPLDMTAEVEPPLPSETPPPASPAAETLTAVASSLTGDHDLSERERNFVRSLAEAAGSVTSASGKLNADLPKSIVTAASGMVDRIPAETVNTFRSVANTAKTAARDFIPDLPTEQGNDLMPPTPEKMPDALPTFNAQSSGKIDVQSDRQADYDQANNKVIFTGKVELNSAAIRLRAERVEVFMKKGGGGMERVEASGHVLMRTQDTENGPGQMASAGHASYNLKTGEITLSDWPKIQETGKSHISTDPSTKMYMFTDGRLRTDGPNRTLIGGN